MELFTDPRCLSYHSSGHPEHPGRVASTVDLVRDNQPDWRWRDVHLAPREALAKAHSPEHLERLQSPKDFDADTAYHDGIFAIAQLAAGATLGAMEVALGGGKAMALMRPPGHHAESSRAMGFCYLNHVAIAAFAALDEGIERVSIWDFDAHHGNGTEAIVSGNDRIRYVSVHQHPCYPGTGTVSRGNAVNFPVPPGTGAARHMDELGRSWDATLAFEPGLILVSAGFDAYAQDPLTQMRLGIDDFKTLGAWIGEAGVPSSATLEGGYSADLPLLVEAFLRGWTG